MGRYIDLLRDGRSGNRILLRAKFSTPVQNDPGTHSVSYTVGTGLCSGVKRLGRGVNHPPQYNAKVQERVELYLFPPSRPSWPVLGRILHSVNKYYLIILVR